MSSSATSPSPPPDIRRLLAQRVLARRRLLQFTQLTHPTYEAGWVHADICKRLEKFSKDVADRKAPRLLLLMPPRHGKQLDHEQELITPDGVRKHGDLLPGDFVYHPSGRAIEVLAIGTESLNDVEIEFFNGAVVKCHENHEWVLYDRGAGGWRTVDAKYLESQRLVSGYNARARFQLPLNEAVEGTPQALPIDPYFLGAWLGDGKSSEPVICGSEADLAQIVALSPYSRGARQVHKTTGVHYQTFVGGIRALLRVNGLLNSKHIPKQYLLSSIEQRLRLLAGLVDTDGSVEPDTQRVRFRSGSKQLAYDVTALVRSLGYRTSVDYTPADTRERHIVGGESWCVQWTPHDARGGGYLARKRATRTRERRRIGVKEIRRVTPSLGRCIQVDSPDGLYMVSEHYVPTHNSELASIRFPAWHLGHYPHHELINIGYNLDLPMVFSRKVRELVRDPIYTAIFPTTNLDPESQSVEKWITKAGGGFMAAGVGGGITGKGAHVLIIDDPIKNQEEADSAAVRDKLWDWYQSTAYTRLAPGGGILCIECMAGETQVLMADGTEKRLDQMRIGDAIATYEDGRLSASTVANWKQSGRDKVFKITMTSGRILRANGRHPFMTFSNGELQWVRLHALTTTHKIVTLPGSGVNGKELLAPQKGASSKPCAEDSVVVTTVERNGQTGTALHPHKIPSRCVQGTSNTGTASPQLSTTQCALPKEGSALSASGYLPPRTPQNIGKRSCVSTTATTLVRTEDCSAISATSRLGSSELSKMRSLWPLTSDFTLDQILSIAEDGEEEVYDLQVDRTENFIANGAVSHNTWWNDDDLAGRLQEKMRLFPEADQFEVIKYPALSEEWEYRDEATNGIHRFPEEQPETPGVTLLRAKDTCLHEARYPTQALKSIRANLQPRIWSALYQQNPVPDEGMYFKREFFKYQKFFPHHVGRRIYTAWDFAISEKSHNDWTVGATILQDENDMLYVMDIHRFKGDSFQIVEAILEVAARYGSTPETAYLIGVEDGQIWRAIKPLLSKRMTERKQYPPYEVMKPLTDKMARARPLQGRMQQGRVVFQEGAHWLLQAEQELLRFPAGVHDDVVDALAWVVHLCLSKEPPRLDAPAPLKSWRDKLTLTGSGGSHMVA